MKNKLEQIMNSNKEMIIKMEDYKNALKDQISNLSYLELFEGLKKIKINSELKKDYNSELLEIAIRELLEEKLKTLKNEDFDEISIYFQNETDKTSKFIKETENTFLSELEIKEKSKKMSEEDFNYKRLAVGYCKKELDEDGNILFSDVKRKARLLNARNYLELLIKYESSIQDEKKKKILK